MSRILLVDNEPDVIDALRIFLESEGHHTVTALDGLEAFEMAAGRQPDVVVTDWKMPHVDGLALCRMLRHSNPGAGLPVILVSGDLPPTDGRATLYDGFLRKPVPLEELSALISRLLAARH